MKIIKNLNRTQKRILVVEASIILLMFVVWLAFGAEIFTKTKVLVKIKDPILGNSYSEWHSQFVWGLDLSLIIGSATLLISLVLAFLFRNKKVKQ